MHICTIYRILFVVFLIIFSKNIAAQKTAELKEKKMTTLEIRSKINEKLSPLYKKYQEFGNSRGLTIEEINKEWVAEIDKIFEELFEELHDIAHVENKKNLNRRDHAPRKPFVSSIERKFGGKSELQDYEEIMVAPIGLEAIDLPGYNLDASYFLHGDSDLRQNLDESTLGKYGWMLTHDDSGKMNSFGKFISRLGSEDLPRTKDIKKEIRKGKVSKGGKKDEQKK